MALLYHATVVFLSFRLNRFGSLPNPGSRGTQENFTSTGIVGGVRTINGGWAGYSTLNLLACQRRRQNARRHQLRSIAVLQRSYASAARGYAANGVLYVVMGLLATEAALGIGGGATDSRGTLRTIGEAPSI